MKQVEFDIELVKKIQSGEVKGCIKTRNGKPARFIGERFHNIYPLIFTHVPPEHDMEEVFTNTIKGLYHADGEWSNNDIIIEIEETKQKCQFKPFDKVLVRDEEDGSHIWQAAFYSHFVIGVSNGYYVTTAGDFYLDGEIIPYEGNEHLVGTTDKPKEE